MHRYGYREVPRTLPDGRTVRERVPLTLEDLLHPQMGDVAVESSVHDLERGYLSSVFRSRLANDPHALVLSDCGVFWDVPDIGHHSPDVSVIFGVRQQRVNWSSFNVPQEETRPTIIVEIVSPDSRVNDVVTKVRHYHLARVPFYFIVDRESHDEPPRLIGYRWTPQEYEVLVANDDGRFLLASVGVWLGIEDGRVACFDGTTDARLGDYTEVSRELAEMSQRAEEEEKARRQAQRRADREAERANAEAERANAEAERANAVGIQAENERKLREQSEVENQALRDELRKLRGG